jgi:mRNA-degrading endonuclease RelE of RelBE toxin-antitoxin system
MSYSIVLTDNFKREVKKLVKKYRSLKAELKNLGDQLAENPTLGTPLGNGVYKLRLAISSKGKGKSGGARIITFVKVTQEAVYLISIYDKSHLETLTKDHILELFKKTGLE